MDGLRFSSNGKFSFSLVHRVVSREIQAGLFQDDSVRGPAWILAAANVPTRSTSEPHRDTVKGAMTCKEMLTPKQHTSGGIGGRACKDGLPTW